MARRNGGFVGQDGLDAPDPPTGITPTAGELSVSVAFTAPSDVGTSAITGFVVQLSTDDTAYSAGSNTGTSSPIVISSLTAGTAATAKVWAINAYGTSAPSSASASFTPLALPRAIIQLANNADTVSLEFVDMGTSGNTADFGDLSVDRYGLDACGSSTRAVFGGSATKSNVIDYVTIASAGNATDFGNLTDGRGGLGSLSSNVRGIWAGGEGSSNPVDIIDYITISSVGNATDFGNLSGTRNQVSAAASPTRGVFLGGSGSNSGTVYDIMEYITIANTGNATDFGNLSGQARLGSACSSNTRIVVHCAILGGSVVNTLEYITTANTGNATDFGDLTAARYNTGSTSNHTLGIFIGGAGNDTNVIDKITIASVGNATDFGDLSAVGNRDPAATSSKHGGIAA